MKTHLFATMVAWLLFANPGGKLPELLSSSFQFKGSQSSLLQTRMSLITAGNSGRGFSYQAILRDEDGQPRANAPIEMRFGLYSSSLTSSPAWQEGHMTTTDEYGQIALTIGKGMKTGGTANTFKDIDFALTHYWLKVEVKEGGSWNEMVFYALPSVPYAEVADNASVLPSGMIIAFAGTREKVPDGWMLCDGRTLSRTEYPALYNAIGTNWGHGDGSSTFHLPDLNGMFLRGVDYAGKHDDDRNNRFAKYPGGATNVSVGSYQGESLRGHDHGGKTGSAGATQAKIVNGSQQVGWQPQAKYDDVRGWSPNVVDAAHPNSPGSYIYAEIPNHFHTINKDGGAETRPDNAFVNYIIKI